MRPNLKPEVRYRSFLLNPDLPPQGVDRREYLERKFGGSHQYDRIAEALKEVRFALLEADVNFKIVKDFIERVRQKAVGQEVLQSLTPGHQVVKVVWEELSEMMGRERAEIGRAHV